MVLNTYFQFKHFSYFKNLIVNLILFVFYLLCRNEVLDACSEDLISIQNFPKKISVIYCFIFEFTVRRPDNDSKV